MLYFTGQEKGFWLTIVSSASHFRFFLSHWCIQPIVLFPSTRNFFLFSKGAFPAGFKLTSTVNSREGYRYPLLNISPLALTFLLWCIVLWMWFSHSQTAVFTHSILNNAHLFDGRDTFAQIMRTTFLKSESLSSSCVSAPHHSP